MRSGIVIFAVLLSAFLAIGYTGISNAQNATSNTTIPSEFPVVTPTVIIPADTALMGTQKTVTVTIQNGTFTPASVSVLNGDTVEWINKDSVPHSIYGDVPNAIPEGKYSTDIHKYNYIPASVHLSDNIESGTIAPTGTYDYAFDSTGTYTYTDVKNLSMSGTITVT
jgi:plastocyanin